MTLKLWDVNMESAPVAVYPLHEQLRSKLCDLYENDSIFDKFECCMSGDGSHVATGTYLNSFRIFDTIDRGTDLNLEATKDPMRLHGGGATLDVDAPVNSPDFAEKLLHLTWHPQEHVIAAAASNSLYMFHA